MIAITLRGHAALRHAMPARYVAIEERPIDAAITPHILFTRHYATPYVAGYCHYITRYALLRHTLLLRD